MSFSRPDFVTSIRTPIFDSSSYSIGRIESDADGPDDGHGCGEHLRRGAAPAVNRRRRRAA